MNFSEKTRNSCALHGALGTLNAMSGVVPVVHATAGCGVHYAKAYGTGGGALSTGAVWGNPLSSTNIAEKHVVFGGGSRLREQLKNTVKIIEADLYAIVTGCATEIVGDDIAAMAKEGRDQGFPVIFTNTPGFRGFFHNGYERVTRSLIEQLPNTIKQYPNATQRPLVNIWGILPQQDPFWKGHLVQLSKMIHDLGGISNPLFGDDQPLSGWASVPKAALNIAVSHWGENISAWLHTTYQTPFLVFPQLPIGPSATANAAEKISKILSLDTSAYATIAKKQEQSFKNTLNALRPIYFTDSWQRTASIVAEAGTAIGLADFIEEYLGIEPVTIIITDPLPDAAKDRVRKLILDKFTIDNPVVIFTEDSDVISRTLTANPSQLVFGSTLEQGVARSIKAPLVRIAFPIDDTIIIDRGFVGVDGATFLLEEIGTAIRRG
jgi:nitrogenase molybdenum-iron protein beta chain